MNLVVKRLGRVDYAPTFQAMQDFTASRTADTPDELWIVEHPPVFTLGQAGKPEHILRDVGIPLVQIDRGGQVTYHGPGQVVIYLLLDLPRLKIKVRELVTAIEQAVIDLLAEYVSPPNGVMVRRASMSAMPRSPPLVYASATVALTTAYRSTSIWIFPHSTPSTRAAMLACG